MDHFVYYLLAWVALSAPVSIYLSLRKTRRPVLFSLLGIVLAFLPIAVLLLWVFLSDRQDVKPLS